MNSNPSSASDTNCQRSSNGPPANDCPTSSWIWSNRRNSKWIEPLVAAMLGITLIATAYFYLSVHFDGFPFGSSGFLKRIPIIRFVFFAYGLLLLAFALASTLVLRRCGSTLFATAVRSVSDEVSSIIGWISSVCELRTASTWIAAVTALGLILRAYFLGQPMRYDESFTFMHFAKGDLYSIFFYPVPNNHVLHTVLVRASVMAFGDHPVAIRLPAFLAGTLAIPTSILLARLLNRGRGGFLAGLFAAVYPYSVLYDTMARGYSLVVLLSLWLAILGLRFASRPSLATCFLMSLTTSLGLLAVPSFIFPAAGLLLWVGLLMFIKQPQPRRILTIFYLPLTILTALLTLVVYTPTIVSTNCMDSIIGNGYVAGIPFRDFLHGLPEHLQFTLAAFFRDVPTFAQIGMPILAAAGVLGAAVQRKFDTVLLLPALLVGAGAVLFAKHRIPFDRTWIFILPFGFVIVDTGWLQLTRSISQTRQTFVHGIVFALGGFWAVRLMGNNTVSSYQDTGVFPEAQLVAEFLSTEMSDGDDVIARTPADETVGFYLWHKNVTSGASNPVAPQKRQFLVVQRSRYSLNDVGHGEAQCVLRFADAEVYVQHAAVSGAECVSQ